MVSGLGMSTCSTCQLPLEKTDGLTTDGRQRLSTAHACASVLQPGSSTHFCPELSDNSMVVYYLIEGAVALTVPKHPTIDLKEGDLLGRQGGGTMLLESAGITRQLIITFPLDTLAQKCQMEKLVGNFHVRKDSAYGQMVSNFMTGFHSRLGRLSSAQQRASLDMMLELLSWVAKAQVNHEEKQDNRVLFEQIQAFVNTHLGDATLDPQALADAFGISLRSVHLLFAKKGQKAATWIREQRLQRARRYLMTADNATPITQIALRSGFANAATFNRIFKRRFGISPGQYRHDQDHQVI